MREIEDGVGRVRNSIVYWSFRRSLQEFKAQFHESDIINVEHAIHDDGNGWH